MPRSEGYARALDRLYGLAPKGMVLGLDTMREALAARGSPQQRVPCVHIAGTNGKGSVSALVAQGLRAAGHRVGLYTSPHLQRFAERFNVDGAPVPEAELEAVLRSLLDARDAGTLPELTFFELATLAAWEVFARLGVDRVVLEVGLGGRLDATNVCEPLCTAITRIALDHEAILGPTIEHIAREKAGILKPGVPCVLGPALRDGEARGAIEAVARAVGAPLLDAQLHAVDPAQLALPGAFQRENAATADAVLRVLGLDLEARQRALREVRWPGRFERLGDTLLDVAHNPDGLEALLVSLRAMPEWQQGPRALVFGASRDKRWGTMLDLLAEEVPASRRFYVAAQLARALEPGALAARQPGTACGSLAEALQAAREARGGEGLTLLCGSVFVVGEGRGLLTGEGSDAPVGL